MTWRELAASIKRLPRCVLDEQVVYLEPYDDGRAATVDLVEEASDPIYVDEPESQHGRILVKVGAPYLY